MRPSRQSFAVLTAALAVLVWLLFPTSETAAQAPADKAAAEAMLRRGSEALERGSYAKALEAFQEACDRFPSPKIFFDIGLAHTRLGNNGEALRAFDRFIAAGVGDAENVANAQRLAASLRTKVATIQVVGVPADAEILLDEHRWGTAPADALVYAEPGRHRLSGRAKGAAAPVTKDFVASAGEKGLVDLTLAPVLALPVPEPPPNPPEVDLKKETSPEGPEPSHAPRWLWPVAAGVVVAAAGVGLWFAFGRTTHYPVGTQD